MGACTYPWENVWDLNTAEAWVQVVVFAEE
ncbi:hypothetical protein Gogos_004992, partial [Gossypium gossypioides]|nr:hypothetical protein [Gossypium gossypioides]